MKNLQLLLENSLERSGTRLNLSGGMLLLTFKDTTFDKTTIRKIIRSVNTYKKKYGNQKITILFRFATPNIEIADKLSYVLFECICYFLINELRCPVYISWKPKDTIWTQGISSSPLLKLGVRKRENIQDFQRIFKKEIYHNHYRKIVTADHPETNYLGEIFTEIDSFLKYYSINEENREQLAEMCSELIGNSIEHAESDCLIDIDVTSDYMKIGNDGRFYEGAYYGVNIVVLNFSERLIGDELKRKINGEEKLEERYNEIKRAFEVHETFFSDKYDETDFYNVSIFQDRISGRSNRVTGGTGLTLLIKSMQEKADSNRCYMLSGDRIISFYNSLLDYDEDGWIGFNSDNNYFTNKPDDCSLERCNVFMPGTAYNLNFVLQREDEK